MYVGSEGIGGLEVGIIGSPRGYLKGVLGAFDTSTFSVLSLSSFP